MPSRLAVAVGYSGGSVNAEVDVSIVVPQDRDESSPTGWRAPGGQFASAPDVTEDDLRRRAEGAVDTAARNMRSPELRSELEGADLAVEDWERVDERPHGVREVARVDPEGDDEWVEYDVSGDRLYRRGP